MREFSNVQNDQNIMVEKYAQSHQSVQRSNANKGQAIRQLER